MKQLYKQFAPFVVIGIILAIVFFGIMLLAYLFLIGLVLGSILYVIRLIRDKFFPSQKPKQQAKTRGRIIDSDDWKKL